MPSLLAVALFTLSSGRNGLRALSHALKEVLHARRSQSRGHRLVDLPTIRQTALTVRPGTATDGRA
jgi:hypothetical protein